MSPIIIRPAQGHDFQTLQAMSCNGGDGPACYPGFVTASHKFFVATQDHSVVGFICAYPSQDRDNTRFVQLHEPYVYSRLLDRGVEEDLQVAVLEWAELKLDIHFFKDDPITLHPIRPHEYLKSLKYNLPDFVTMPPHEPAETLAPQGVSVPSPAYTPA